MNGTATLVPVGVAVICLVLAGLMHFLGGGRGGGRGGELAVYGARSGRAGHAPRLQVLLVMAGSMGLIGTSLGASLNQAVTSATGAAKAGSVQLAGGTVVAAITLALLYVIVEHWRRRQVGTGTLGAAALLPVVGVSAPGTLGVVVHAIMSADASLMIAVARVFGVH